MEKTSLKGISKGEGLAVGKRAISRDVEGLLSGRDLGEAETAADGTAGRVVRNEAGGSARAHISGALKAAIQFHFCDIYFVCL